MKHGKVTRKLMSPVPVKDFLKNLCYAFRVKLKIVK